MKQKRTFQVVLIGLAILLMTLPVMLTFNDVITRLVMRVGAYRWLQERVVPLEVGVVGVILRPTGIKYVAFKDGMKVGDVPLKLAWNCVGWQSMILFVISASVALKSGDYRRWSKVKALVLGGLGIFWLNILRVLIVVVLAIYAKPIYQYVFHDILAAVMTVAFLVAFWWWAYSFILEEQVGP